MVQIGKNDGMTVIFAIIGMALFPAGNTTLLGFIHFHTEAQGFDCCFNFIDVHAIVSLESQRSTIQVMLYTR